jgi:beta-glucosidase
MPSFRESLSLSTIPGPIELASDESKQVSVPVTRDRLTIYDEASDSWKLVPGNYVIRVGTSSQDLSLQQAVTF